MFGSLFGNNVEIVEIYTNKSDKRVAVFRYIDDPHHKYGEQIAPLSIIDNIKGDLECRCYELPDGRQHVCSVCQHEQDRISREESEE